MNLGIIFLREENLHQKSELNSMKLEIFTSLPLNAASHDGHTDDIRRTDFSRVIEEQTQKEVQLIVADLIFLEYVPVPSTPPSAISRRLYVKIITGVYFISSLLSQNCVFDLFFRRKCLRFSFF